MVSQLFLTLGVALCIAAAAGMLALMQNRRQERLFRLGSDRQHRQAATIIAFRPPAAARRDR